MTTFTIDNDYISVALDNENYTPAAGEVQKVNISAPNFQEIKIDGVVIKWDASNSGEPNVETIPVIIDDTQTVRVEGGHISGFVIN